ncbi:MAG: hypothetical protein K6T81_08880 [Alicyclobacillus macrosporangiidus]|uniref:hypothetical protein n=1 Tax=Alicyclobacillus macrosporangiidus TaxID=392015 RepID=UPI0026F23172|nr:hypothetical protein [Alicyclobacillus macrosporangiidus]MCL6598843.1 hypothetical protein [Alicyclobacillus macrosporangiidus]
MDNANADIPVSVDDELGHHSTESDGILHGYAAFYKSGTQLYDKHGQGRKELDKIALSSLCFCNQSR